METSIRLFRIRGISVGLNWSWFAILALIVWTLASEVFPSQNEGYGDATYVGMGIVAAVLFFSSLLAHELGHAIQAQREGMQIDGITLWLFGGVARFKGMFPNAGAEFRIAIAGLAALSLAIAWASETLWLAILALVVLGEETFETTMAIAAMNYGRPRSRDTRRASSAPR